MFSDHFLPSMRDLNITAENCQHLPAFNITDSLCALEKDEHKMDRIIKSVRIAGHRQRSDGGCQLMEMKRRSTCPGLQTLSVAKSAPALAGLQDKILK